MKKPNNIKVMRQSEQEQPKFRAINNAIERKILQRKTGINDSEGKNLMHHGNQFCLCCSRIFKEGENASPRKTIETVRQQPKKLLSINNQISLTLYQQSKSAKKLSDNDAADLNKQNLRLIEANMKFWDDYRRIKQGIQMRIMSCRLHVQNYDSLRAKKELDGIENLINEEPSDSKPVIPSSQSKKLKTPSSQGKGYQHQQLQFYQSLIKTLEGIICDASQELFPQTKSTLQSEQYFSVQQFHRDVKDLCAAKFTTQNLDKIVDMSLKHRGATVHLTAQFERSFERTGSKFRIQEVQRILKLLYKIKSCLTNQGLIIKIQQEIQRLEREYDVEPRQRSLQGSIQQVRSAKFLDEGKEQINDQRYMLFAQARVIQSFLQEHLDKSDS